MSEKNISAVLQGIRRLELEERPVPDPGPGEVQFAIVSTGICGSDVTIWETGYTNGTSGIGVVMGHESSGVVTKLGQGVTSLQVGDRVAVEPGRPCRVCEFCKSGFYYQCVNSTILGIPPKDGNYCRYNIQSADFCYRLPDHVSFEDGAMLEPLAVGVYACKRGEVSIGKKVLIMGAGPIGLICLLAAKAMGAEQICVTNTSKPRLEVAKKMGADHVIHIDNNDYQGLAATITQTMGGMADSTIECSGAELAIQIGIYATKPGSTLVLCGIPTPDMYKLPMETAFFKEIVVRSCIAYPNCYPTALSLVATGAVDVTQMITHRFPLEDIQEAFEVAKHRKGGAVKVMINHT